ncbi:MMPL family transporter [Actinophytocola oryzae]|uniref:RND superfamily putative drug exporter n=1 Tax=Actinophytocola oryzae TaxID=502181 RepID=A0A4R7VQN3_9PSEU|nr:MMPL family transporter [Actinophytocola oryzae]TDV52063.1 RND superfamily putative drug exporter [Actinophytocola oryzae]
MGKPMLTVRVARWSAEHPWRAIGAWLLFVAICIGAGQITGTRQADFDDNPTGELATYQSIVDEAGFTRPATENVLISAKDGTLDQGLAMTAAADVRAAMDGLAEVGEVSDPLPSPKHTAVLVNVEIAGDPDTADERVDALLDATASVQDQYPGLRIEEVGGASLDKALSATLGDDFQKAELISIPVTLVIMLVVFGAVIAAGVPVLLAMSAVGAALGLSALASQLVPATDNTSSMILLIGMAVGVDYSLFYVRRDREERARGAGHVDAVEIAAATSGHAIVVSGIAVTVAMAGMFVVDDVVFSSIAVGTILVVLAAMIGSITVLPALLAKLGRFVDKPRVPLLWRFSMRRTGDSRFWRAVLKPSLRAPRTTLVIAVGVLAGLAVPTFSMTLNSPGEADLPRSIPIMRSYDRMTEAFPSTGASHQIAVRVPADQTAQGRAAVDDLLRRIAADPGFAHDRPPTVTPAKDGRIYLISAGIPFDGASAEADQSLARLRGTLVPATIGTVSGAEFAVSGQTAGENDFVASMTDALPWVIGFVLLLTFLVMLWAFRAPVIALSAIGLNLLSAGAAYGVLVLVFQNTWAEGVLGFTSTGGITAWLPVILFVTLFGLSMDYHVFVVSRIREATGTMSTKDAVAAGITRSAGVVTSAAAVMVGVFSIFATLSTIDMKQMGVGLAVAILIDATLIRAVLLPALMTVLGRANWWTPRFLRTREEVNANEETRVIEPVG